MRNSAPIRPGRARHHDHALRQIDRLEHRMGDEDDGLAQVAPQRQQIVVEPEAGDLVERRERLVHQQNIGIGDQRARQRHPHLHAAGQFARIGIGEIRQARPAPAPRRRAPSACVGRRMRELQRQAHIFAHAGPRHQRRLLKHEADRMRPCAAPARWATLHRARRSARSGRRSAAAPSTCRSRTARAARRTRPCAHRDRAGPAPPRRCRRPW